MNKKIPWALMAIIAMMATLSVIVHTFETQPAKPDMRIGDYYDRKMTEPLDQLADRGIVNFLMGV